ncbi:MAG: hypothetical protein HY917_02360 [Candidatus Diapherotrites archaeon]|nr:hypothetical protein [Candidatus Diapherotrites archaeon]
MLNSFYDKFIFTNTLKYSDGNFWLVHLPFMLVPVELMVALLRRNDADLNQEIYYAIKEATLRHLLRQFDLNFGLQGQKAIEFIQAFFTASGWGTIHSLDSDVSRKRAILVVEHSPFAMALKGKTKLEVDHYLRGLLAGIFSAYFAQNSDCVEVKCMGLGAPHCEFLIKPSGQFKLDSVMTRRQLRT